MSGNSGKKDDAASPNLKRMGTLSEQREARQAKMGSEAETFERRWRSARARTSAPNWNEHGAHAIAADLWERMIPIVERARKQGSPAHPYPSAESDGTLHLQWSQAERSFDLELTTDGSLFWSRRIHGKRDFGPDGASIDEVLVALSETFRN